MTQGDIIERIKATKCLFEETQYAICYYSKEKQKLFTYQNFFNGDYQVGYSFSGKKMDEGFHPKYTETYATHEQAENIIKNFTTDSQRVAFKSTPLIVGLSLNRLLSRNGDNVTESWDTPSNKSTYASMDQVKDYEDVQQKAIDGLFVMPFKTTVTPA